MRLRTLLGSIALAGAVVLARPVEAAIMQATWTGVVTDYGTDNAGIWGPAGGSLLGLTASAVFKYDTTIGDVFTLPGLVDRVVGGTDYGQPTPILDAWIEINGIQLHFAGDADGAAGVFNSPPGPVGAYNYAWTNAPGGNIAYLDATANFVSSVVDMTHPFQVSFSNPFDAYAEANFYDIQTNTLQYEVVIDTKTLTVERLDAVGGVPEPASWTLMILGFGTAGAVLRRRRMATGLAIS